MPPNNGVAIVTGGGTGIGQAVSLALARAGVAVVVNYSRSQAEADAVVDHIHSAGGRALAVQADVSRDDQVTAMVRLARATLGPIRFLVNNAGITRHIPMADLDAVDAEAWDRILAVNVMGMFYCARAAAADLRAQRGAIVNVGSISGFTGAGSSLPYAVSKAAVHGLTRSLARALGPDIRVNAVAPGEVATRWWAGREQEMGRFLEGVPLGHAASPEDVAHAVLLLLQNDGLTGQVLTVDAGQIL